MRSRITVKKIIMGYIKHNSIIFHSWRTEHINEARKKAVEIYEEYKKESSKLVSEIIPTITNSGASFFIAPDGSKEGWDTSKCIDKAREELLDWLKNHKDNYTDYIEVRFGGDYEHESIVRSKDSDLDAWAD
jgi:hypothetical protein